MATVAGKASDPVAQAARLQSRANLRILWRGQPGDRRSVHFDSACGFPGWAVMMTAMPLMMMLMISDEATTTADDDGEDEDCMRHWAMWRR